jgi:hypothetical protein
MLLEAVMRTTTMAFVAAVAGLAVFGVQPVDARQKVRAKAPQKVAHHTRRPVVRQAETMDDIRANSQDPSGNYSAFPSWARIAFTHSSIR